MTDQRLTHPSDRLRRPTLGALAGLLALTACNRGDKREFLGPPDPNPVDRAIAAVVVVPRIGTVPSGSTLDFAAFARRANGDSVGVEVSWTATGGAVTADGRFSAQSPGSFWVIARSIVQAEKADSAQVQVVGPDNPITRVTISPKSVPLHIGQTQAFSAAATFQDGSPANVPVFWSASAGYIGPDGAYTPDRAGQFLVIAVVGAGLTDTATVVVRGVPVLTSLVLDPPDDSLDEGDSLQYTVTATWNDGSTATPLVDFSTLGGVIDSAGMFTALAPPGGYSVTATEQGGPNFSTASVTVRDAPIVAVDVSPSAVGLAPGATQRFTATGRTARGNPRKINVNWQATGGSIGSNGTYTAGSGNGTYRVVGTLVGSSLADTAVVTISTSATLTQLVLNPSAVTLAAGDSYQFSVAGSWSDGSSATPNVTWTATGGTVSNDGEYTAGSTPGSYRVIAKHQGGTLADTSAITVTSAKITKIVLTPATASVVAQGTAQFTAAVTWSDGATRPATLNWTATGGAISSGGLYTAGTASGTYRVIARDPGFTVADTSFVTITSPPPVLLAIVVTPASVSLEPSQQQQFTVQGVWSNGSTTVPSVTWSATGGSVNSTGRYTAGSTTGTFRVIALDQSRTKADTSVVTITPPAPQLIGIKLSPGDPTTQPGGAVQFSVQGIWTGGGSGAPPVVYGATGGTVTSGGLYRAGPSPGNFRVIATQAGGTLADTSAVTISGSPPVLVGLTVSPDSGTVLPGGGLQFAVNGTWSGGGTGAPAVTWSATGGSVNSSGYYTAGSSVGTYRVIANQVGGSLADTATVFVAAAAPSLTSFTVQPASATLQAGMAVQFTATATWSNGTTTTPATGWTATGGGTMSSNGLYTAGSVPGSYKAIGTIQGGTAADTAVVTIVSATVTKITLTPASATLPKGGVQQFAATATWSDGVNRPVAVSYSATGGSINVNGLYTAGQVAGTFAVIAACGCGKADTSSVDITGSGGPTLVSLSISPGSVTLPPSGTQQFQVIAQWSDGSSTPPAVAYTTTGGTITTGGLYTAPSGAGSYKVYVNHTGGTLADTAAVVIAAQVGDPVPSGTIVVDTRKGGPQSIQNVATMTEALAAIQSSPLVRLAENDWMKFTTDLDGNGTRAFRAEWNDWGGVPGGQGRRIRTYFAQPPKQLYIQWKHWMGRTPTGGGIGAIGAFDATNELDPSGNASRKYLIMPRAVPGLGNTGRADFVWTGPSPVKAHWNFVNLTPNPGSKGLNRSAFDPEAHYNEVITFTMYFQAESFPGASDGILRIWYNGVLRAEWLNQPTGDVAIDRFNMSDTFQSPIQDQTEYFWDLVVWLP